jgi:hypothetical protein
MLKLDHGAGHVLPCRHAGLMANIVNLARLRGMNFPA